MNLISPPQLEIASKARLKTKRKSGVTDDISADLLANSQQDNIFNKDKEVIEVRRYMTLT